MLLSFSSLRHAALKFSLNVEPYWKRQMIIYILIYLQLRSFQIFTKEPIFFYLLALKMTSGELAFYLSVLK